MARDAFTAALPLAANADARRWCELWLAEATWRADPMPPDIASGVRWAERQCAFFEQHWSSYEGGQEWHARRSVQVEAWRALLLAPYADGRERDDVWFTIMKLRSSWTDRLEIAQYLRGHVMRSPAAAERYAGHVRECVTTQDFAAAAPWDPWVREMAEAASMALPEADRVWFAVATAWLQGETLRKAVEAGLSSDEVSALKESMGGRWATALEIARGTRWETGLEIATFFVRLAADKATPPTPAELRAELARLKALLSPPEQFSASDPLRSQLHWFEQAVLGEHVSLSLPGTYIPGTRMEFDYSAGGTDEVHFDLFRFTAAEWIGPERRSFEYSQDESRQPVHSWRVAIPGGGMTGARRLHGDLPEGLSPGFYFLRAIPGSSGRARNLAAFLVTGVDATVLQDARGSPGCFLFDRKTKVPLAGVNVRGCRCWESGGVVEWDGRTGEDGRLIDMPAETVAPAVYDTPHEPWAVENMNARSFSLAIDTPAGPAALSWTLENQHRTPPGVAFVVERPIVRPGETVRWKAIARDRVGDRFVTPPAGTMIRVSANGVMAERELATDEFGTVSGEFSAPTDQRNWSCLIEARRIEANVTGESVARAGVGIETAEGSRSQRRARLKVVGASSRQKPGGAMRAQVEVTLDNGTPIADAEVEFLFICPAGRPADGATFVELAEWRARLAADPIRVRTNRVGRAESTLALPRFLRDATWLSIGATVRTDEREPLSVSVAAPVASRNLVALALIRREAEEAVAGKPFTCEWVVCDASGEPRAMSGEVWLYERRSANPPGSREALGGAAACNNDLVVYKERVRAGGDGKVSVRLTPPRAGEFFARLAVDGRAINGGASDPTRETVQFRARSVDATLVASATLRAPQYGAPRPGYRLDSPATAQPGAPLKFDITTPMEDLDCWLTVASDERVVVRPVRVTGGKAQVVVDDVPRGRGLLRAGLVDCSGVEEKSATISINREQGSMAIECEPLAGSGKQGGRWSVRIQARDSALRPLVADVTVVVREEVGSSVDGEPLVSLGELAFEVGGGAVQALFSIPQAPSDVPEGEGWRVALMGSASSVIDGLPWPALSKEGAAVPSPCSVGVVQRNGPFDVPNPFDFDSSTLAGAPINRGTGYVGHRLGPCGLVSVKPFGEPAEARDWGLPRPKSSLGALWSPSLRTNVRGVAEVDFDLPAGPRRWRIEVLALAADGDTFVRGSKVIEVR